MLDIRSYNKLVRSIGAAHSARFGLDTPKARREECKMIRRVRREYPISNYGITWR